MPGQSGAIAGACPGSPGQSSGQSGAVVGAVRGSPWHSGAGRDGAGMWVRTKILEEDFRRRQLRGGDDGSSGYGMQGSKRGRGRGFGGAGHGAKKDDDSNDQQGGTGWGRGAKSGRGGKSGAGGKMKGSC
ncbi:unnamed protein product, partial [Closterium sp. NIES-53]